MRHGNYGGPVCVRLCRRSSCWLDEVGRKDVIRVSTVTVRLSRCEGELRQRSGTRSRDGGPSAALASLIDKVL
jgi:hypothetical protein